MPALTTMLVTGLCLWGPLRGLKQHAAPPAAGAPQTVVVPARRLVIAGSRVLLPEGTFLLRSPGRILVDPATGGWRFLPRDFGDDLARAIPIAPGEALTDIARAKVPADGVPVEFTGEVLQYHNGNWLMPDLIVLIGGVPSSAKRDDDDIVLPQEEIPIADLRAPPTSPSSSPKAGDAAPQPASSGAAGASSSATVGPRSDSDEAAEILRQLRDRVGPVPRSSARIADDAPATPAPGGAGSAAEPSDTQGAVIDPARGTTTPRRLADQLVRRRGVVVRDNDRGGWRFVSATEDGGSREPAVRLVPSRSLEQLEQLVRSTDQPVALLVSGQISRFRGEDWLRVTEFVRPRTGTTLSPGARPSPVGGPTGGS
ncbi:MAG: hypothetical protein U0575_03950 [Phycisphaerales bacterium]